MSTTERKARKKAGIPFPHKPAKIATPPAQRAFVTQPVFRKPGDLLPRESPVRVIFAGIAGPRSAQRALRFIQSGGVKK